MLILLLDSLEEFKDLSLEERNTRNIFQSNLESLLQHQKEYWKQGGIKWATFGDENTRFFHAHATIKHNKNSIMILKNDLGEEKSKHEDEAAIL
jgi:hypothetical protein